MLQAIEGVQYYDESSGAQIIGVELDDEADTVYVTMQTLTSDAVTATDAAEDYLRQLSAASASAAADRLSSNGDDSAAEQMLAFAEEQTDECDGLGALYRQYGLVVSIDNDMSTLDIDGQRTAGPDGGVNWQ